MTDNQDNPGINVPPPPALRVPLVLGWSSKGECASPLLPRGAARGLGWPHLCGGVALNGWFLKTMRDGEGAIRTDKPVPKLTTTGPFRYTRNPGYLALTPILGDIRGVATEPRREAARRG